MTTSIQHNSHAAPAPLLLAHGFKAGQTVRAHYFVDPQFKNEIYKCEVLGVKETWMGISLLVQPCANRFNLLSRWITVHQVVSADTPLSGEELYQDMVAAQAVSNEYALLDTFDLPADHATYKRKVQAHVTALRAAAAYTGCSAEPVIEYLYGKGKTVQAAPIVPQDALPRLEASTEAIVTAPVLASAEGHKTDNGRKTGVIDSYSVSRDYGYVFYEGETLRFTRASVLGGGVIGALIKGQTVTFAQGVGLNATNIVIPGNESSETAYAYLVRHKSDAKKAQDTLKTKEAARKERLAASRANRHLNPAQ